MTRGNLSWFDYHYTLSHPKNGHDVSKDTPNDAMRTAKHIIYAGSGVASLPAVVVQSNIFFLKLTEDFEIHREMFWTIGEMFVTF